MRRWRSWPHSGDCTHPGPALGAWISGSTGKGVAMKKFAIALSAVFSILLLTQGADASWGSLHYGGYQPWWNIFAKRQRCLSAEEERLQRFWHDYYDALKNYYCSLDAIDWVAYYKNHGYQINGGCGPAGGGFPRKYPPGVFRPRGHWAGPGPGLPRPLPPRLLGPVG